MTSIVISRQKALGEKKENRGNENVNKHVCGEVYGRRNEQKQKQVKDCESSRRKMENRFCFKFAFRFRFCAGF